MKNENCKQNNISIFSTICAVLIVLRHSDNFHKVGPYLITMNIDDNILGKICMFLEALVHGGLSNVALYGFFVLSGYLFYKNYSLSKTFEKYKSRFRTIFVPYLLWHTITYVVLLVLTNLPFISGKINTEPISWSVFDYLKSIIFPQDIYWYLNYLIVFVIFTPLMYFLIQRKLFFVIALIGIFFFRTENRFIFSLFCFLIGGFVGIHYSNEINKKSKIKAFLSGVCLFVIASILAVDVLQGFMAVNIRLFTTVIGIWCLWNVVNEVSEKIKLKLWLKQSFFIYCAHGTFYFLVKKVVYYYVGTNPIHIFIAWWVTFGCNMFIVYVFWRFIKKNKKIYSYLCGGRT